MTHPDYVAWARYHATLYGFVLEADLAMLASWYDLLGAEEARDLTTASKRMAVAVPRWPRDHLSELVRIIRTLRAERVADMLRAEDAPDRGSCVDCASSGRVLVPHLRGVIDGRWEPLLVCRDSATYYVSVAYCHCPLGKWYADHGPQAMRIEDYDGRNPNWRKQLARRAAAEAEEVRLNRRQGDDARLRKWRQALENLVASHRRNHE